MVKNILMAFVGFFMAVNAQAQQLVPMTYQEALAYIENPNSEIQQSLTELEQGNKVYQFINDQGDDSVGYVGQTFRQVLINDIKLVASSIARGDFSGDPETAYQTLDSYYSYDVNRLPVSSKAIYGKSKHLVTAKTAFVDEMSIYEGVFYSSIYPKTTNLQVKTAGVDNPGLNKTIKGWKSDDVNGVLIDANGDGQKSPEEFIRAIMRAIANNAASAQKSFKFANPGHGDQVIRHAAVTTQGIDLSQLLQKVLHGAVSFNQATSDYLSVDLKPGKGLTADNEDLFPNRPFTVLQHHWDEAFGYFGASRDYGHYHDGEIAQGYSRDSFDEENYGTFDKEISLEREKNFALAVNAGKRDVGAKDGQVDFSKTIFDSFLQGRHLIQNKPVGYLNYAQALSVVASVEWEKVIAASTIHYINEVLADYNKYGSNKFKFTNLAKHFSEMKGFALAPQFSTKSPMSSQQFEVLHNLLGDKPILPGQTAAEDYQDKLLQARELFKLVYDFSQTNVENW
jgi:hypothetical protein